MQLSCTAFSAAIWKHSMNACLKLLCFTLALHQSASTCVKIPLELTFCTSNHILIRDGYKFASHCLSGSQLSLDLF